MLFVLLLTLTNAYLFEDNFDTDPFENGWVQSGWKKDSGEAGEFGWSAGTWFADEDNKGLRTTQDAKFYAISKEIPTFNNEGKSLVFQLTVKNEQKIDCGGGYFKLFGPGLDQQKFEGGSEYQIMFGPDICGFSTKRIHSIFNHKGTNLLINDGPDCETDEFTHIYTLEVEPDNTFRILVDGEEKSSGSMYDKWDFELPKEINDPDQSKPADWVDEQEIDDPDSTKPDDWVEDEQIVDPDAEQPEDWDEEDDGEWEAPMIPNPDYKGPWRAERIPNPDYKGPWVHPKIANPDYVHEENVYLRGDLNFVGMEVWQVKSGTVFDNILVTDDKEEAKKRRDEILDAMSGEEEAKKAFDEVEEEKKEEEADADISEDDADLDELEDETDLDKDEL